MRYLNVDRIRCDGRGLCAELLPELLTLDDWGYPIVLGAEVSPELEDSAERAVAACPVLALRLYARAADASKVTVRNEPANSGPRPG